MKKVEETKELVETVRKIIAESLKETAELVPSCIQPKKTLKSRDSSFVEIRKTDTVKDNMSENKLINVIRDIVEEALNEALPFGFGKGKMNLGGQRKRPEDEEEGPEDDFLARGGSASDEFSVKGAPLWDPNEDISDPEELEAVLTKMTKSAWDPDEDEDEVPAKGSPKKRVDLGTGYGVEGDTFEKIGEKMGYTPEAAKKAVATAAERFKVLHDMDPEDLNDMVYDGLEEYIGLLNKTGELTPEDVTYMKKNADHLMDSESFREFFSKYVKRAVRDVRADTQDDDE